MEDETIPGRPQRDKTDESLRIERRSADDAAASDRAASDDQADEVVRLARQRADQVVRAANATAGNVPSQTTRAGSQRARTLLEHERWNADHLLAEERSERNDEADRLADKRKETDKDLNGERAQADTLIVDQREANQHMLGAAIRAHDLSAEAAAARERAEESERKLRTVAEFREMFIGMLGHDLRNPLGSIGLSAELLLRRGHLEDHDAKTVSRIIRSHRRMVEMVTQLLDLTRARLGGGLPLELEPADLRDICRNVVEEFEESIEVELAGDLTGHWDQGRVAQVISNLVGNAIEYATPGTAVILNARGDGDDVVAEISNQGHAIPTEVLPLIFEPFRRAKQHEKSAKGNLGLGLYIAEQVVLSHGGTLHAHSAGGMTTFTMRLPRRPNGTNP